MWEALGQHWHCTPAEARAQDENDVELARAWINAHVERSREDAYFA